MKKEKVITIFPGVFFVQIRNFFTNQLNKLVIFL